MRSVVQIGANGKGGRKVGATAPEAEPQATPLAIDARAELIQALIPTGPEAVSELLKQEVTALAGARYGRGDGRAG